MKILQEWREPENSVKEVQTITPSKIDLAELSNIVNELNEAVAPEFSKDAFNVKQELITNGENDKAQLEKIRKLNDDYSKLKHERLILTKKSKVVELLGKLYSTYQVSDKFGNDMLKVMDSLDTFDEARLDRQIKKLKDLTEK